LVELGFGTHFLNEMRPFAQAARHAHTPRSATPGLQRLLQQRFHLIGGEELDSLAHSESKLIRTRRFCSTCTSRAARTPKLGCTTAPRWSGCARASMSRHCLADPWMAAWHLAQPQAQAGVHLAFIYP